MTVIGDVLTEYKEAAAPGNEHDVLTLTERRGFVLQSDRFKKRLALEDTSGYKVIRRNNIAFNPYLLWAGAIARNSNFETGVISPLYPTFSVKENFDPSFISRLLLSDRIVKSYDSIAFGSVPRRRRSSVRDFLSLELPEIPSLEEQRYIASILDEADTIRTKRRAQLAHLDEAPQALFREMFGDPMRATGPRSSIRDIAPVLTGNTPSRKDASNYGDAIEWIKSDNLGKHVASRASEGLSVTGKAKARIAPTGSILVTCIAGSPKSIGKASTVDRDVAFNQQINAILPSNLLEPTFIHAQLTTCPELVRAKSSGGMKGLVSKSAFESIQILVPPRDLQVTFATKVATIRSTRDHVAGALKADDELFAALQHRAFRGEL